MDNLDKLVEAEERIAQLDQEIAELSAAKESKKLKIDNFKLETEDMTAESIEKANKKLTELKEAAKKAVDALETKEALEVYEFDATDATDLLETKEATGKKLAEEAIVNLPKEITLEDKEAVKVARELVDVALEFDEELEIKKLEDLVAAEERIVELEKAFSFKIEEISTLVSPDDYTRNDNRAEYEAAVKEIKKELASFKAVSEIKNYDIEAKFSNIYTDEDCREIENINETINTRFHGKVDAANNQAIAKSFEVNYRYDGETYEIAIGEGELSRGISATTGTGFATGFVHVLTTANSHKNDIGWFKIKLTLSGFLEEFKFIKIGESIYYKDDIKVTETSIISGGGILEDLAREFVHDAGVGSKFRDFLGSERIVEHHFELSSGKTYVKKMQFKFTDEYIAP